jgi:hypothetical protein
MAGDVRILMIHYDIFLCIYCLFFFIITPFTLCMCQLLFVVSRLAVVNASYCVLSEEIGC